MRIPPKWGMAVQIVGCPLVFFCRRINSLIFWRSYRLMSSTQVIHIHVLAPAKPAEGMPCNGCGVCCLAQPCPLGMVLSGARTGACQALRWNDGAARYVCGAIDAPYSVMLSRLPSGLRWLAHPVAVVLPRLARRWIAAGVGCDSSLLAAPERVVGDNEPSLMSPDLPLAQPHD